MRAHDWDAFDRFEDHELLDLAVSLQRRAKAAREQGDEVLRNEYVSLALGAIIAHATRQDMHLDYGSASW